MPAAVSFHVVNALLSAVPVPGIQETMVRVAWHKHGALDEAHHGFVSS
jgi:hypothetical protein